MDEQAPKIIMIAGPKGGVGKTTIALNLSILLAKMKKRVLLVDCDYSSTSIACGQELHTPFNKINLMGDFLGTLKTRLVDGVEIIPSPIFQPGEEDMIFNYTHRLIEAIRRESKYDYCIIDTSSGYSRSHHLLSSECDCILLISTAEPPSISAAYSFLKLIYESGVCTDIRLIINQVSNRGEGIDTFQRFAVAVGYFLERSLGHIGSVPEDEKVVSASKEEKPLVIRFPHSDASNAMDEIAIKLAS